MITSTYPERGHEFATLRLWTLGMVRLETLRQRYDGADLEAILRSLQDKKLVMSRLGRIDVELPAEDGNQTQLYSLTQKGMGLFNPHPSPFPP